MSGTLALFVNCVIHEFLAAYSKVMSDTWSNHKLRISFLGMELST